MNPDTKPILNQRTFDFLASAMRTFFSWGLREALTTTVVQRAVRNWYELRHEIRELSASCQKLLQVVRGEGELLAVRMEPTADIAREQWFKLRHLWVA